MNIEIIRNTLYKVVLPYPPVSSGGFDLQVGGLWVWSACDLCGVLGQDAAAPSSTPGVYPLTLAPAMGTRLHRTGSPSRSAHGGPR